MGAATVIETDTLLVKCPHCGGRPMAASFSRNSAQREIRFRCAQCRQAMKIRSHSESHLVELDDGSR